MPWNVEIRRSDDAWERFESEQVDAKRVLFDAASDFGWNDGWQFGKTSDRFEHGGSLLPHTSLEVSGARDGALLVRLTLESDARPVSQMMEELITHVVKAV